MTSITMSQFTVGDSMSFYYPKHGVNKFPKTEYVYRIGEIVEVDSRVGVDTITLKIIGGHDYYESDEPVYRKFSLVKMREIKLQGESSYA